MIKDKIYNRWISIFFDFHKFFSGIKNLIKFLKDLRIYSKMQGAEPINFKNVFPRVYNINPITSVDPHYFYQDIWAFKHIYNSKCKEHIDIGSNTKFVGLLSTFTKVTFVDIRPLKVKLDNFKSKKGNILSLPYDNDSVSSLSCLHVAEHIGLGRYGDKLDPYGTKKAALELSRILAPGGNLYFSLPIGKPRLCFNAHRIHSTQQILDYFHNLKVIEVSGVIDNGRFIDKIDLKELDSCNYACGLFLFRKL